MSATNNAARKVVEQAAAHLGLDAPDSGSPARGQRARDNAASVMAACIPKAHAAVPWPDSWKAEECAVPLRAAYVIAFALVYAAELICDAGTDREESGGAA